jgi:hypothetical protein
MSTTEFCVYNQTRASFLTPRVTVIDAQSEPLKAVKALIEGLAPDANAGLWLNPLKSIPTVPRLSAYDLVYLDHEGRVVHGVELVPDDEAPRFDGVVSALVLPAHTFAASQTIPGDRVVFRLAEDRSSAAAPEPALISASVPKFPTIESCATAPKQIDAAQASAPADAPLSVVAGIGQLQPLTWPLPSPDAQPSSSAVEPQLVGAEKQSSPFEFLRSIVRLRIRVQISISTAPPTEPNAIPATLSVSAPATNTAPQQVFGPDFSRAAIRSQVAAGARSFSTSWAVFGARFRRAVGALAHRASFFATVTTPIFFEHTVPAGAKQIRRAAMNAYKAAKGRYLRWADAFMFHPATVSAPRIALRLRLPRRFRA